MPYNFAHTGSPLSIAEQQYATAGTLRFSKFTSCIGLLARNGANVTGVHLVMFSNTETPFANAAADAAILLLGAYQQVVVIGQAVMWNDNLPGPYHHLLAGLHAPVVMDVNDGVYGGRVVNNVFQTFQNGNYINV